MEQSKSALERIYTCLENLNFLSDKGQDTPPTQKEKEDFNEIVKYKQEFIDAMNDDLNTASAISAIFDIVKETNLRTTEGSYSREHIGNISTLIKELGGVLGLLQKEIETPIPADVQDLIEKRSQARKDKDFAEADKIRDMLLEKGVILKDTPQGVQITYK